MARARNAAPRSKNPFNTLANALDEAARVDGQRSELQSQNYAELPSVSKLVYSSSYALTYALAFPSIYLWSSISADNPAKRGAVDAVQAVKEKLHGIKNEGETNS
jgi:hypothetical protein